MTFALPLSSIKASLQHIKILRCKKCPLVVAILSNRVVSTPWARFNQAGAAKNRIRVILPVSYKIYHDHPIPPKRRAEVRPRRDVEKNVVLRLFGVPVEHRPYCLLCGSYKKRERNDRKMCDNRQKVQDVFTLRGNGYFPAPCRGTRKNKTDKQTTITFL